MHIASLAVLLTIAVLRADAALCIEEDEPRQAEPVPVMMCRLSMFEDDSSSHLDEPRKVMRVKRLVTRREKVADDTPHGDAPRENVRAPIKEPHAPGVYSYADSDSWTSSDDGAIGQIVIQSHQDGVEIESGIPGDAEGNVEETNEYQQADGEIEYSSCGAGEGADSDGDKQLVVVANQAEPGLAAIA